MEKQQVPPQVGCPIGCPRCDLDGPTDGSVGPARWQGWRLAAIYALVFLWPLALAVVGAIGLPLFWRHPHSQAIGGIGGLLLGAIDAAIVFRFAFKGTPKAQE